MEPQEIKSFSAQTEDGTPTVENHRLTAENYSQGFLVDDEFLGGVSENRSQGGGFVAFVMRHSTGETLAALTYPTLELALAALNAIPKDWVFDSTHGCGNGECNAAENGKCPAGKCGKLSKAVST